MYSYRLMGQSKVPAPAMDVKVSAPWRPNFSIDVSCIIDTGASITVIPLDVVQSLNPREYNEPLASSFNGDAPKRIRAYILNLAVENHVFEDRRVITTLHPYGLIGRDFLNSYLLACDAPNACWDVKPRWR